MKIETENYVNLEIKPDELVEAIMGNKKYELVSISDVLQCSGKGLHERVIDSKRIIQVKLREIISKDEEAKLH